MDIKSLDVLPDYVMENIEDLDLNDKEKESLKSDLAIYFKKLENGEEV